MRGLGMEGIAVEGQDGAEGMLGAGSGTSSRSQVGVMFCALAATERGPIASTRDTGARTARICPVSHVESGAGAERGARCGMDASDGIGHAGCIAAGLEYVGYWGYAGEAGYAGRETGVRAIEGWNGGYWLVLMGGVMAVSCPAVGSAATGIARPSMTTETPTPRRSSSSWRRSSRFSASSSAMRRCCRSIQLTTWPYCSEESST